MNETSKKKNAKNSAIGVKHREKKKLAKRIKEREKIKVLEEFKRDAQCDRKVRCVNNGGDDDQLLSAVTSGCFVDVENALKKENETCSQEALDKCLLIAARTGQKLTLTLLLKSGANSNYSDENGDTPMMVSAEQGYVDIVRILIANKADINASNKVGCTALMCSVHSRGCAELTRLLVSSTNVNMKDKEGRTALIRAILIGDIDIMKVLIMNGAVTEKFVYDESFVDTIDKSGIIMKFVHIFLDCRKPAQPSLIAAMKSRDIHLIETILTSDTDCINLRNLNGETALDTLLNLIIAEKSGISEQEKQIIKLLISRGIEVKKQTRNRSIRKHQTCASDSTLVKAVQVGDLDVVRWLCMLGAQVNDPVDYGQLTPLMMAAREGCLEIMNYLLSKQAAVEVESVQGTALDIAVNSGHLDCAKRLLEEIAKTDLKQAYKKAIEYKEVKLVQHLVNAFTIDLKEMCFMEWAIGSGSVDVLEYLIKTGMDINSSFVSEHYYCRYQISPIHLCVRKKQLDLVKLMIHYNANINIIDFNGDSALFYACTISDASILKLLLQSGADVNAVKKSGKTPLLYAVEYMLIEHVKLLLEYGAFVDVLDNSQDTPLSRAIEAKSYEIVCILLDNNADTCITLKGGKTYLMLAVRNKHYTVSLTEVDKQILNKLLHYSIDVNKQDENGNTALMMACLDSATEFAEILLNHGADVNLTNNDNKTALSYSMGPDYDLTKILLMRKAKFTSTRECQQAIHWFLSENREDLIHLALGQGVFPYLVNVFYSADKKFSHSYTYSQGKTHLNIAHPRKPKEDSEISY